MYGKIISIHVIDLIDVVKTDAWLSHLLSRRVWTLAGVPVITRSVERYRFTAFALVVVHLVTLFDFNLMHFNWATAFATHYNFGAHDLTYVD